jgi:hypothetical protein
MATDTLYHVDASTDWSLAASWRTAIFGAGSVPDSTDTLYFTNGSANVTAGLSNAAVDLTALYWTPGFSGRIGTAGTPLTIAVQQTATGICEYAASAGYLYLTAGTNGIYTFRCKGGGKAYLTGGTFDIVEVASGECDVNDQVTLNSKTVRVYGGYTVIDYKGSDTPTIDIFDGTVLLKRAATVNLRGGRLILQVEKVATAIGTLTQTGGHVDLRAGNITTWNGDEGTYSHENTVQPITVGTLVKGNLRPTTIAGRGPSVTFSTVTPRGPGITLP